MSAERSGAACQARVSPFEHRLAGIGLHALARHGPHIAVQQTAFQEFRDERRHAAGGLKGVDVPGAVGINQHQQGHRAGKVGKIVPVDADAGGPGHGHQMHGLVGRAARGQQPHHGIHHGFFTDDVTDGGEGAAAQMGHAGDPGGGGDGERLPQRVVRVDKGGPGQVQPEEFRDELVAVGGAVKGAGPGAVVGLALNLQHLRGADPSLGEAFPGTGLLPVAEPRAHRAARHQDHGQMSELQRAHEQPGQDLVADAEQQGAVKNIVGKTDHRGHGDDVTADQTQVHARLALGHPIAHGRHAGRDLGHAAGRGHRLLENGGIGLVGVMGGKQIIVGSNDGDMGGALIAHPVPFSPMADRHGVGQVAGGEPMPERSRHHGFLHVPQVIGAMLPAAAGDSFGDVQDGLMHPRSPCFGTGPLRCSVRSAGTGIRTGGCPLSAVCREASFR